LPINKELAKENAYRKIEDALGAAIEAAKASGIGKDEIIDRLMMLWEADYE
jgi:hypothetical protein